MEYKVPCVDAKSSFQPRIIIHGGAGNITRANLPHDQWLQYRSCLLRILKSTSALLTNPSTTALTAATHAVRLFESDPLFNCGHGAVFTRAGHVELEASVMVSRGHRKRGVAVSGLRHVKSPISLAADMLRRGDRVDELAEETAQGHVHLSGEYLEDLAKRWDVEMCEESYFWTRRRWEEHKRGLEREKRRENTGGCIEAMRRLDEKDDLLLDCSIRPDGESWPEDDPTWDGVSYLPQGTVGCVVLDRFGVLCTATSTGGLTNKLPGRIGDTPSMGAGFWAEEWSDTGKDLSSPTMLATGITALLPRNSFIERLVRNLPNAIDIPRSVPTFLADCLPHLAPQKLSPLSTPKSSSSRSAIRGVALSGTGNGDSFLQLNSCATTASLTRFQPCISLDQAITWMAGQNGQLQRSAGERWGVTGEGVGGIIGIELRDGEGKVVADFNGGMFRAWIDDEGRARAEVGREDDSEW